MQNRITLADFSVVIRGLKAVYTNKDFIPDEVTLNVWYRALQDIDYPTLDRAAQSYMMSNHYAPQISDLRDYAYNLTAPADDLAAEEWARLMKALGYAGLPDNEAFGYWERLPEVTKEIVGGFSEFKAWANTPTVDLMSVQRPMFIKRFEEKSRILRSRGSVPSGLAPPIKQLTAETAAMLEDRSNTGRPNSGERAEMSEKTQKLIDEFKRKMNGGRKES